MDGAGMNKSSFTKTAAALESISHCQYLGFTIVYDYERDDIEKINKDHVVLAA